MNSRRCRPYRVRALALVMAVVIALGGAPVGAFAQEADGAGANPGGRTATSVILHTVGGAIVGGWLGWVGSHVSYSDWNEEVDGDFAGQRWGWVLGGILTGVIASQLVGPTYTPGAQPELVPYRGSDRNVITRAEIQSSGATNAYELVQGLRGEWLQQRGVNRWAESSRGSAGGIRRSRVDVEPGDATIVVYMNASRLGGVEELRNLPIDDLQLLERVSPQAAAVRYGSGHAHGVIQLSTELRPTGTVSGAAVSGASGPEAEAAIRAAAIDVFMERGYRGTSLNRVAERAGLSRERVRLHYSGKAELFDAVIASDLAGRLDVRLRQWIQTDEPAMEDRLVALLQERRREIVIALTRAEGSTYEQLGQRLSGELSTATLARFRDQDVERLNRATRTAVAQASDAFVKTLGALLEATPDPDELDAALRAQNRYHLAGIAGLLER